MEKIMLFVPFVNMILNIIIIGIIPYLFRHEKQHTKIDLLLEQVCKKLEIHSGK